MPNRSVLFLVRGGLRIASAFDPPPPAWNAADIRSILLINTTAVGDTLMTTPAIRAIRRAFPKARLVSLASHKAKAVLLHNPHLDQILDHPGRIDLAFLARLPRLVMAIRRERCDLAVILHGNDPDAVLFAYLSGARYRVGWETSQLAFALTHRLPFDQRGEHLVHRWKRQLTTLGIAFQGVEMDLPLTDLEEKEAERFLTQHKIQGSRLIGIHPFANTHAGKVWPMERVTELGRLLVADGFVPVIIGGPAERATALRMVLESNHALVSAAGALTLRQSMALIKRLTVLVTQDSGPFHIAQALGTPVVVLYGPSDPRGTGPLSGPSVIVKKEMACSPCGRSPCHHQVACMVAIDAHDVRAAVHALADAPVVEGR